LALGSTQPLRVCDDGCVRPVYEWDLFALSSGDLFHFFFFHSSTTSRGLGWMFPALILHSLHYLLFLLFFTLFGQHQSPIPFDPRRAVFGALNFPSICKFCCLICWLRAYCQVSHYGEHYCSGDCACCLPSYPLCSGAFVLHLLHGFRNPLQPVLF